MRPRRVERPLCAGYMKAKEIVQRSLSLFPNEHDGAPEPRRHRSGIAVRRFVRGSAGRRRIGRTIRRSTLLREYPRGLKLLPSSMTVSAWWSSRSRTAEVRVASWLKISGQCLNTRFVVIAMEPRS